MLKNSRAMGHEVGNVFSNNSLRKRVACIVLVTFLYVLDGFKIKRDIPYT